jgi:hypothetical protein
MTINSYFYDSVDNDRPYSAGDFAKAFGIILSDGVIQKDETGALGFDIGGTNYTTIYAGKATVQGHFVEIPDTEILTVTGGTYSGQVVLRVDYSDTRIATLVVRTDRVPQQDAAAWEMPLYNVSVTNGIITAVTDMRIQGGAVAKMAADTVTWDADPNGAILNVGRLNGTGKPIRIFFTSAQPAASSAEIRAWFQIDKF